MNKLLKRQHNVRCVAIPTSVNENIEGLLFLLFKYIRDLVDLVD